MVHVYVLCVEWRHDKTISLLKILSLSLARVFPSYHVFCVVGVVRNSRVYMRFLCTVCVQFICVQLFSHIYRTHRVLVQIYETDNQLVFLLCVFERTSYNYLHIVIIWCWVRKFEFSRSARAFTLIYIYCQLILYISPRISSSTTLTNNYSYNVLYAGNVWHIEQAPRIYIHDIDIRTENN